MKRITPQLWCIAMEVSESSLDIFAEEQDGCVQIKDLEVSFAIQQQIVKEALEIVF